MPCLRGVVGGGGGGGGIEQLVCDEGLTDSEGGST